jgi:hypothetical protein
MPRARILSLINYKGGVAKTTSTHHIGCSLAQHFNKKVLLVDIDPQTNLTFLCASIEKWTDFKKKASRQVCGLDYPFTLSRKVRSLGAARLVSTPSRPMSLRAWLGIAILRFPRL